MDFFLLNFDLAIAGPLWFCMNFKIVYFSKNVLGILIGIALGLYITLGSIDILTNIKSSTP